MAGQPKYQAMVKRIEEKGGVEWFCGQIADGGSLRKVAAELGCSRWLLQKWIEEDPDRERSYEAAKLIGASAMVEEGQELLDDADVSSTAGIQKARNQADYRKWRAGVINRPAFGPPDHRTSINVFNVENLHLAALQAQGGPEAQKLVEVPADMPQIGPGNDEPETEESETGGTETLPGVASE